MNDNHCKDCGRFAPTGMDRCWDCTSDRADEWWEKEGHKIFDEGGNRIKGVVK